MTGGIFGMIHPNGIPNFWKMEKWITSEICDKRGGIYSWKRNGENGYIYDEITGYGIKSYMYLYYLFKDPRYLQMAQTSVDYINKHVHNNGGGISRDNIDYVFDTSICLSGILSYCDVIKHNGNIDKKMVNFIYNNLLNNNPIKTNGVQKQIDLNHWSLSYGSHLLKCNIVLSQLSNICKKQKFGNLMDKICIDLIKNCHKGHFYTNSNSNEVYTHSHCYATEGLIYSNKNLDIIKESAEWLANVQNQDGSLYNRYYSDKVQEKVTDATAQAIRIWLWTDRNKFIHNIEKGFSFLKSLQSPEGGIYYKVGSIDINSWSTMFTINALAWYNFGVDVKWLI